MRSGDGDCIFDDAAVGPPANSAMARNAVAQAAVKGPELIVVKACGL